MKKSVISLISYDAHFLPDSIKTYYSYVDEIVLGLDEHRISWAGNKFTFDEEKLYSQLQQLDHQEKINIIESNFHGSKIPMENETYERNYLKAQCENKWIFSFDADEQLVNANDFFVNFLPLVEPYYNQRDLLFTWILPYKEIGDEVLIIANEDGSFFSKDVQGFVTHRDNTFMYGRWTNNQKHLKTPLGIMHYSFCRNDIENELKTKNYGHSDKTDIDPFYSVRNQINLTNYTMLKNFKTSGMGEQWNRLIKVPKNKLQEMALQQAGIWY